VSIEGIHNRTFPVERQVAPADGGEIARSNQLEKLTEKIP
jgi:hypothetical protein